MRLAAALVLIAAVAAAARLPPQPEHRYLYVALPAPDDPDPDRAVRILVFDIANAHRFVRRIPVWPAGHDQDREVVRGTAASLLAGRLCISTTRRLAAMDLKTDRIVWEQSYEDHCCDRPAVSPD